MLGSLDPSNQVFILYVMRVRSCWTRFFRSPRSLLLLPVSLLPQRLHPHSRRSAGALLAVHAHHCPNGFRRLSRLTRSHKGHCFVLTPAAPLLTLYLPKNNCYFLSISCLFCYNHTLMLFFHFLCIYLVSSTVSSVK